MPQNRREKAGIRWDDVYTQSEERTVYTFPQHRVEGVHAIGLHRIRDAIPPLPWHYHADSFEFSVATKGCIAFSTPDARYQFSGGDIFISFPNEVHGTAAVPITVGEICWFQLDVSDPDHVLFLRRDAAEDLIGRLGNLSEHVICADSRETHPLIQRIFRTVQEGSDPYRTAVCVLSFLHTLLRYAGKEQFRLTPDIGRAVGYVADHITEAIQLETLAETAGLSLSQFKQKFRKQMGVSPRYYVNLERIRYAKQLLAEGKTVTETAMELSFGSGSYFSAVFRKYTRQTPAEYAKTVTRRMS